MKTKAYLILLALVCGIPSLFSQGFQPPSAGKAVVYFIRTEFLGCGNNFEYFDNDKYFGDFSGINYLRYECDPGNHLFWAASENKEFITANLKEGGIYIVNVFAIYGFSKYHVQLNPLPPDNKSLLQQSKSLVNSKTPVSISPERIEKMNAKKKKFINEMLEKYNKEWKDKKNFNNLSADMAIPVEALR